MIDTELYTKNGEYVAMVLVPPFMQGCEADVLMWGERFFLRRDDGKYYECFCVFTFTKDQVQWGASVGAVT